MKTFLLPLICILVISYGFYLLRYAFHLSKEQKESLKWPFVKGNILKSELTVFGGDGHLNYDIDVSYEYVVNSKKFTGTRVYVTTMFNDSKECLEKIISPFKKGEATKVFYNPKNPAHSALIPGIRKDKPRHEYAGAITIIVIGAALVLMNAETFKELYNVLLNW